MGQFSEILMDHFSSPRNSHRVVNPDLVGLAGAPGNGPYVALYIRLRGASIVQSGFETHGCGVSIACGSMLTELILDRTVTECLRADGGTTVGSLGRRPPDETSLSGPGHRRPQRRTQGFRERIHDQNRSGVPIPPYRDLRARSARLRGSWDWVAQICPRFSQRYS